MKTVLSIFIVLMNCTAALAQNKIPAAVAGIRKTVQQINAGTGYTFKKLNAEEFLDESPDNGGELDGCFKNGQLVKMIERIGLSSCVNTTEYYLDNGKLIFTYTKGTQSHFNDGLQAFDDAKPDLTMEYRFYFNNGKLVHSILKGSSRCSGEPTTALAKEMLQDYERYKKLLLKK